MRVQLERKRRTIWVNESPTFKVRGYNVSTGEICEANGTFLLQDRISLWVAEGDTFRVERVEI